MFGTLREGARAQESKDLVSVQARILQDGAPVSADLSLTFEVYDAATSGNLLWGPETQTVQVRNGILSVKLGANTSLGNTFKNASSTSDRYVAIKLAGNEIVPRVRLTAVPYAHRASSAEVTSLLWDGSSGLSLTDLDARYVNNAGEIAGAGLEDDGSGGDGALRIASSAAGNGLTGGSGSALAVGAGTGITVAADAVSVDASAIAGSGLTGSGSTLSVGAGDGISVAADAVAVNPAGLINGAGGTAIVNGDKLEIDYSPTNYTRTTGGVSTDVKDLAAHLKGIDDVLGSGGGGGYTEVVVRVFDSSGTYTPTSGMVHALVICTGGGGGGGGADATLTTTGVGGGGGGAGGTAWRVVTAAQVGASQTVTIGGAGSAGSTSGSDGGNGGTTSLGSLVSATGGTGGDGHQATGTGFFPRTGSAGGAASGTFTLGISGGKGTSGLAINGNGCRGGDGGASFWGGGGSGGAPVTNGSGTYTAGASTGEAGAAYGSGGGGGTCAATTSGGAGGAGKVGVCVIVEYCN